LFSSEEEAKDSLKLNGQEFKGRHLRVDLASNPEKNTENSVFVGNLPFDVKDEELWEEFKEFGEIKYVRVIRNPSTFEGKGIAYVCFVEKKPAKRAIAKNNSLFRGRRLRVSKAVEPVSDPKAQKKPSEEKKHKFYDVKSFKKMNEIVENAPIMKPRHPSALKGTKKIVRKEQIKLQNKRQQRKENNTKIMKKKKKVEKE
jgi:nucleolar protein 12